MHVFPARSLQHNVQAVASRALLEDNQGGFNHLEGHHLREYSAHLLLEVTKVRVRFHHIHNHDHIAVTSLARRHFEPRPRLARMEDNGIVVLQHGLEDWAADGD